MGSWDIERVNGGGRRGTGVFRDHAVRMLFELRCHATLAANYSVVGALKPLGSPGLQPQDMTQPPP
jgi:hypothetical protein